MKLGDPPVQATKSPLKDTDLHPHLARILVYGSCTEANKAHKQADKIGTQAKLKHRARVDSGVSFTFKNDIKKMGGSRSTSLLQSLWRRKAQS